MKGDLPKEEWTRADKWFFRTIGGIMIFLAILITGCCTFVGWAVVQMVNNQSQ